MAKRAFIFNATEADSGALRDGIAGIFNEGPSAVYIHSINISRPSPHTNIAGFPGRQALSTISASSGGTLVSPQKFDTAAAALSSLVELRVHPDSVTTVAALTHVSDTPSFSSTAATPFAAWRLANVRIGLNMANILRGHLSASGVEVVTLREGQGIALAQTHAGMPHSLTLSVVVVNTVTSRTYMFRTQNFGTSRRLTEPLFSLMNGTGSGAVLQVKFIYIQNDGETNMPVVRLARIDGYSLTDSTESAIPTDTTKPIPSTVKFLKGPFLAQLAGANQGIQQDWNINPASGGASVAFQHRQGLIRAVSYPGQPFWDVGINAPLRHPDGDQLLLSNGRIVLNPSEGIALLAGRAGVIENSNQIFYDVQFKGYVQDPVSQGNFATGTTYVG